MGSHGFFTLGGALSRIWRPAYPLLPWALTSALLVTAGMWSRWAHGGPIDWILVGLSAYELMLGILEKRRLVDVRARQAIPVNNAAITRVDD